MWTPKRFVLMVLGFFAFFSGYLLYASALGGIDGLPPLPAADLPSDHLGGGVAGPPTHGKNLEDKLRLAFGQDCPELKWPLKLELNSKNMVVAAKDFSIEDDGRLQLVRVSVALFGKESGDGRGVEINTIRATQAFLTFDKKLGQHDKDFAGRRIVAAELHGSANVPGDEIQIVNNHRTPQRDDDLHLTIQKGPLYYDESKSLIWTDDYIRLEDDQNQPPTVVLGCGMEVHLTAADPRPAPRAKSRSGGFTGVDRIVVKSGVDMHLYVAGGFLSNGAEAKAKAAPAERTHVSIKTPGCFEYEFRKDGDVARFDAPEGDAAHPAPANADVHVIRHGGMAANGEAQQDQLVCQHLELHLSRKQAADGNGDSPDHGLTIDSAHATVRAGNNVTLASDEQKLSAYCFDLTYDARTKLTVLKTNPNQADAPLKADQNDNIIHSREIQILELPPGPDGRARRQVTALGPGRIDLCEKKKVGDKETKTYPVHIAWQDKLVSTKDGDQDLIVLTGAANFLDDEHGQSLQADTLKVWMLAAQGGPAPAPPAAEAAPAGATGSHRPSHIEAVGNVSVASEQLTIPHTGLLMVWFRDAPPDAPAPPAAPTGTPAEAAKAGPTAATPAGPDATAAKAGADPAPPDATPPRPVDLTARSVYAWVLRDDQKSTLDKIRAEGDVSVHQDPAKADEKGVDVVGASLEMWYHPEGNFLVVMGDLAELRMEGLYITGPTVSIDQAANKSWVDGPGGMEMMSKTDLQGQPLKQPVPLTVTWVKQMFFDGRTAEFTDGVQAEQDDAHLTCQAMNVEFDHAVSLKKSDKAGPPPRVKSLVCRDDVRVDDRTMDGQRVVRQQRIHVPALRMNAIEPDDGAPADAGSQGNEIHASGPGSIRLFQQGGQDPLAAPPKPGEKVTAAKPAGDKAPAAAKEEPTKITYVRYGTDVSRGSMYVNTKTNTAKFFQDVQVLSLPSSDPNMEIDLDKILNRMPEGSLYLKCDRLEVYDRGDRKKSQQEMYAYDRVRVQAKDFYGYADRMTYNEAKDQIIFEGGESGLARLYKIRQQGAEPQLIEGKTIVYVRSTGMFKVDGGGWISGN